MERSKIRFKCVYLGKKKKGGREKYDKALDKYTYNENNVVKKLKMSQKKFQIKNIFLF